MTSPHVVSVIMPVHNAERYVAEAVQSILHQTFRDFEFLIVDDGSTDRSPAILQKFAEQDPRIRLISRPNTGYVVALNEMVGLACGALVARMDADDIAHPERFQAQVQYMNANPEIAAIGTWVQLVDPEGRKLRVMQTPESHAEIDAQGLRGVGLAICHPSAMIRLRSLKEVGGYSMDYPNAEDVDLFLRLAEVGQLVNLPQVGLCYRMHHSSVGHMNRAVQARAALRAAEDACKRRGLTAPIWETAQAGPRKINDTFRRWGWWALRDNHVATARRYATKAILSNPTRLGNWKLLMCALRGY